MQTNRDNHIAEVVCAQLKGRVVMDARPFPDWIGQLLRYFSENLEASVFNPIYLRLISDLPTKKQLGQVSKKAYLVIILKDVAETITDLNFDRVKYPDVEKSIQKAKKVVSELTCALLSNASVKKLEKISYAADASAATAADNATYYAASDAAAYYAASADAASADAAYYAAAASADAAYYAATAAAAADATYYAAANAAAAANVAATYYAANATYDTTRTKKLSCYFEELVALITYISTRSKTA